MQRVSLFIPCAVDAVLVDVGEATVKLLRHLGFNLVYHEAQTCCGQPAITAGHIDIAKDVAKRFIELFEKDEYVVSPSGSCLNTVKHSYPQILADEPAWYKRSMALSKRVFELSEFLVDVAGIEDVNARYSGKIAYHKSCHLLRGLGVDEQPLKLLANVKEAELVALSAANACCGFGGQFSYKYPHISEAILADKVKNFIASTADVLIVAEPGCLMNINGYLHRHHPELQAQHLACFLADNLQGGA